MEPGLKVPAAGTGEEKKYARKSVSLHIDIKSGFKVKYGERKCSRLDERYARTALLMGSSAVERLAGEKVLVCGVGGVGSYIAEALARGGVGAIDLLDFDVVSKSNINRQIVALESTIGRNKAEIMAERIADINPNIKTNVIKIFLSEENIPGLLENGGYDFVADAIDSVPSKVSLIYHASRLGVPMISSMGTGNKLDPTRFSITDISKTSVCPLAKKMRYELKKLGVRHHTVLFSNEEPTKPSETESGRHVPGSVSFVPSCAGLMIAGYIIKKLAEE